MTGHLSPFELIWCIIAVCGGATVLWYAIHCIRRGWISAGRPPKNYHRASDPNSFWGNVVWLMLGGTGFLIAGLISLMRKLAR